MDSLSGTTPSKSSTMGTFCRGQQSLFRLLVFCRCCCVHDFEGLRALHWNIENLKADLALLKHGFLALKLHLALLSLGQHLTVMDALLAAVVDFGKKSVMQKTR